MKGQITIVEKYKYLNEKFEYYSLSNEQPKSICYK